MKHPGLRTYSQQMDGRDWEIKGPLTLRFARPDGLVQGVSGKVNPGMLASEDMPLGVMLAHDEAALAVIMPDFPIPDKKIEALYAEGVERSKDSEYNWIDILQARWVTETAHRFQQAFFDENINNPPTVAFMWNPDETMKERIVRAEIVMKGRPNDHPLWIMAAPEPEQGYDFDM